MYCLCLCGEVNGDGDFDGGVVVFLKDLWVVFGSKGEVVKVFGLLL